MRNFLNDLGFDSSVLVSGLAGALMSLRKDRKKGVWENILVLSSGALCANYITPVFLNMFPTFHGVYLGIGFLIGFAGLSATDFISDRIFNKSKKTTS